MKFSSKPVMEHPEVPLADHGQWEELVANYERRHSTRSTLGEENRCYVLSVGLQRRQPSNGQLSEILGLVKAQGDRVVGHETRGIPYIDPRTYLSKGVCREVAENALRAGANMLVLDAELTPSQTRNLEDAAGLPICDREAVILNVFLKHARSRRARIQVEVAHLSYLRPRSRGMGLTMDQQAGGLMNARGPGETASELLARQLDGRLLELRKELGRLSRSATQQRAVRSDCKRITLVGYTNAGKTTLMNALTDSELSAKQKPFETLDTTTRSLSRWGEDVVVSDTVGFIRNLPERLMASFESTLAEVSFANLLAVVIDASDPEWCLHIRTTERVLENLHAENIPRIYLFNKADRSNTVSNYDIRSAVGVDPFVQLSGQRPSDVVKLKATLLSLVLPKAVKLFVPYDRPLVHQMVYAGCQVVGTDAKKRGLLFQVRGSESHLALIESALQRKSS